MFQEFKNYYHFIVSLVFCVFYRYPAKNLKVIGVTGTDGKTTTSYLIYHILKTSKKKVSLLSSIKAIIGDKEYDTGFHFTTPDPSKVQRYLWLAKKAGSEYMILETTSHALHQNRVAFCNFLIAVLTNITPEHLDYHKTYKNYFLAKMKLLRKAKKLVVNKDDKSYNQIPNEILKNKEVLNYGLEKKSDINPLNFTFKTSLPGKFNRYNILAAIGACKSLGLTEDQIKEGIETFKLPKGREEIVYDRDFKIMIDFAHTPNAFENILSFVKPKDGGKLIHVFGSAGERDNHKRPEMGKISSKYADVIILTSEDPRSESIEKITEEIAGGVNFESQKNNKKLFKIPNREEAIKTAVVMAKKGDFILLTGKSHEKSMNYGKGEEPWDEYEVVKKALRPGLG